MANKVNSDTVIPQRGHLWSQEVKTIGIIEPAVHSDYLLYRLSITPLLVRNTHAVPQGKTFHCAQKRYWC
jgi:hypothetical protein